MTLKKLTGETFACDRCERTWTDSWVAGVDRYASCKPSAEHKSTLTVTPNKAGRPYDYDVEVTHDLCKQCHESFTYWLTNMQLPPPAEIPAPTTKETAQ